MREEAPERAYSRGKGTECEGHSSPRSPLSSMQGAGAGAGETDPGGWGPKIYPKADSDFWGSGIGKRWGLEL